MEKIRRNNEIKLRLAKEEKDSLEKKAEECGLKLSQYIRLVSIRAKINTEEKKI